MRRTASALALTLLLGLSAACSDDKSPGSGGTPTTGATSAPPSPSPSAVVLTRAQLDAALLVAADLPAGFEAQGPGDIEDEDEGTPTATPSQNPCSLDAEVGEDSLYGRETGFLSEKLLVNHQVEQYEPGDATTTFALVRNTVLPCKELVSEDEDGASSLTASVMTNLPALGDEVLGLVMSGKPGTDDADFRGALVVFRVGDVVSSIVAFAQGESPEATVRAAATKAAAKLQAVLAGGGTTPGATAS